MRFSAYDKRVRSRGRCIVDKGVRYLGWSGSSLTFKFTGKTAKVKLLSDPEAFDESLFARVAVFLDDEETPAAVEMLTEKETELTLFENETERTVTVTLMKYSEAAFAYCGVEYIETDGELEDIPEKERIRIEFIGDSITCGYGVEAANEFCGFRTDTENPTLAYSLRTAKMLDAEVNMVCWSGNGIISRYVDEDAAGPLTGDLMPEVYGYTDLPLSRRLFGDDADKWEKWDFSAFVPDLIIINLGTNDCSWTKDVTARKAHFRKEYAAFLNTVRRLNPGAMIVSVFGTMDQRLTEEIRLAVRDVNDGNTIFLELPLQDPADGLGANYHPGPKTHRKTAEYLVKQLYIAMADAKPAT